MPPVVIAAGIGAAAGIGGAALSSSAQKKAANKAADTSLAVAEKNNALQKEIYGQNSAMLNPYVQRGNEAGAAINALLGISGTASTPAATAPGPAGGGGAAPSPAANSPMASYKGFGGLFQKWAESNEGAQVVPRNALAPATPAPAPTSTPMAPATTPNGAYQNAFQNYLNSSGYQFQMDQGNKAINQGYAAQGSLQSGAALKALQAHGQNTATGFFKDYLGLLSNQQGVGLSGASATAGVGQNYANSVGANNNSAGSAAANAHLAAGNANANLYGQIAGGIAGVANAFGSSYRRA